MTLFPKFSTFTVQELLDLEAAARLVAEEIPEEEARLQLTIRQIELELAWREV